MVIAAGNPHPNFLREWIILRGYKVKRLADRTGIPLRTLWEYIGERAAIEPDRLQSLAVVLGCSPEQLVWNATQPSGSEEMDKKRRELLRLLSTASVALLLPLPDLDWERLASVLVNPSYLDVTAIRNLEALGAHYWELYLATPSKSSVLDGVVGQLKTLVQFLKQPYPTSLHQRICCLTSDLAQLTGEIFFDRHEYGTAQSCYVFAASAAKEAGAYDLWSSTLVRHSFTVIYDDQPRFEEALPILEEAWLLAQHGDSSLSTKYWVAAVEAEARSGIGDLLSCQVALERAGGVLELKHAGPAWARFDQSRLSALRGACFVRLEQPSLALPALQEALQQSSKPGRKRGMVLTDLATAALQCREIELACAYLNQAIDIVELGSSGFLRDGVRKVRSQLAPYAGSASVNRLDQRMHSLV